MEDQLTNDELGRHLAQQLMRGAMPVALNEQDQAPAASEDANPLETDFFRAINAFRAARTAGNPEEIAAAERHLQDVVRGELTGEDCSS